MKNHYKKHVRLCKQKRLLSDPHRIIAQAILRKFSQAPKNVIIAIGGPGGTGKSTFAVKLAHEFSNVTILALDDYKTSRNYRAQKKLFGPHPEANNMDMLAHHLSQLKKGCTIKKPVYCREKGTAQTVLEFDPAKFIIAEGEIATYKDFHEYVDFSIFIDSHWKTQLNTRISRDIEKRGYTPQKAIAAFLYSNLHEFPEYGSESKNWSDIHIHCTEDHNMIIDAVCSKSLEFMIPEVSQALADEFTCKKTKSEKC